MHIVRRQASNADVYRLKGRLSAPAAAQLSFIVTHLANSRDLFFDCRQVTGMEGAPASDMLKDVLQRAPKGTRVRISGLPDQVIQGHSRQGLPREIFV